MAHCDGVDLARRHQTAQHLAHLAASGQRSQEQLNLFHTGGNHGLQIDRSQDRDGCYLRRRRTLGNGLLIALAQKLPFGGLAWRRDDWNDPELLPQLGDGTQHGPFGHFAAERMLEARNGGFSCFEQLVGLHCELRHLARTCQLRIATPVAISAQRIYIGQNPARDNKVRLLGRLALQIEAHGDIGRFQADQQLFGERNVFRIWSCIPLTGYGFNKRWRYR
jgi:hypothetical protein